MLKFKEWLQINYDSLNTRKTYLDKVSQYYLFAKEKINQETFNNYLISLEGKQNSTYNQFLCAMKVYCKYSKIELEFPKSRPKIKKIKEYITVEQLEKDFLPMLSLLFPNDWQKREVTLLTLFFSGMRKSELVNLKREDIDFENKRFIIRAEQAKSNQYRIVPILSNKLIEKIKQFYKYENEGVNAFNLTIPKIDYLINKLEHDLELKISFHPHVLRRSFAKYCNDIGFSLADIKYLMGHSDIKTTEEYIQSDERAVIAKAEQLRR